MQIKFNIPQAEQVDSSGDFRSRLETSSLVFARSLAVDLWQVYYFVDCVIIAFRIPPDGVMAKAPNPDAIRTLKQHTRTKQTSLCNALKIGLSGDMFLRLTNVTPLT